MRDLPQEFFELSTIALRSPRERHVGTCLCRMFESWQRTPSSKYHLSGVLFIAFTEETQRMFPDRETVGNKFKSHGKGQVFTLEYEYPLR